MKIHILLGRGEPNTYTAVVHSNVPTGNNQVGIPWSTAMINAGLATSSMTVGTGPGQITQTEFDQITAGQVMEGQFVWQDDPTWTNAERQADLDARATQMVNELGALRQAQLKLFGATRP